MVAAGSSVVVTGGTSGIGLETAALLAERGAGLLIVNGRDVERGEAAVAEILRRAPGASVSFLRADVSTLQGASDLFRTVAQRLNAPLDVLVNCGGGDFAPELFHQTPGDHLQGIIDHWLMSRIFCCHAALPLMRPGAAIVNVASDAAKMPTPGEAVIGAAMAGMAMFSRTLAMEAKRQGIRVNVVTPSVVAGPRLQARIARGGFGAKLFEKAEAAAHLGMPDSRDIAETILFLASSRASKLTGQVISVNGGISAG